jgi:hypothetical protein
MSIQPALPAGRALERLFTPSIRLGWTFRDRNGLTKPYPEPQPDPEVLRKQTAERAAVAQASYSRARRWVIKPSLALGLLLLLTAGYAEGRKNTTDAAVTLVAAMIVTVSGLGYTIRSWWRRGRTAAAQPEQNYRKALEAWEQRAADHHQAELARLGQVPEWASASPPALRTDIFGGSLRGWKALLTTHGASILVGQPLLVMDLSGQFASGELTSAAQAAGVPAAQYVLPADLDRCGLLSSLSPAEFADALTEAIHAGTPGGARADRAIDVRVLEQLAAALDGWITPARLAAAAQSALGQPIPPGLLTAQEEMLTGGDLFPASYRQQVGPNLVRLDAFLADLARYAGPAQPAPPPAPAYYTCLAMDAGARSARAEMLTALSVQWLTVQVSASRASAPAVIIAGADEITRPHLERLSDACERRGVPLTVMFRHLREDTLHMLGGGTAAFMRLGNHAEAEQAAAYIGRQHKFVLSQLTATSGGNQGLTRSDTQGFGDSDNSSRSWQEFHLGPGSRSRGTSTSRNWSTSQSWADGTSWSEAEGTQRVYEFAVEPTVLQNLPDHALLLAARGPAGPQLQAVECDPAIATLPGLTSQPSAPAPVPVPADTGAAQLAPAAPPSWPASPARQSRNATLPPTPSQGPRRPPGRHRA